MLFLGRNIASYLQIIMQPTQCPIKSIDVLIRKLVKDTRMGVSNKGLHRTPTCALGYYSFCILLYKVTKFLLNFEKLGSK